MTLDPARHYIGGDWIGDGPLGHSLNPATLAPLGQYHSGLSLIHI